MTRNDVPNLRNACVDIQEIVLGSVYDTIDDGYFPTLNQKELDEIDSLFGKIEEHASDIKRLLEGKQ